MKNSILITALAGLLTFSACNGGYKKTETGLQYKFLKEPGQGRKPRGGDFVLMEYTMHVEDSILVSTYDDPDPHLLELPENPPRNTRNTNGKIISRSGSVCWPNSPNT